ncbi:hypothetical protein [Streptococcus parauberis]|uniref:hypothetical protein n=1 Tax=Streptococcus parauberis TaxID=1348 RepID=UPI0039AFC8D7
MADQSKKNKLRSSAKNGAKSIGLEIATEIGIAILGAAIKAFNNKQNTKNK